MLRVFLSILFFCFSLLSYGQSSRIYDHRDYGFGELSSNLINSITQDKNDYIWIATEYGLNKFDGVRFVQYLNDAQDSNSLSSNHVTILHRDKQDRLWIGCSNGLQYYDEDSDEFIRITFPDQIAPHITDILNKSDGSLLVTTSGWGIFSIDPEQLTLHSLPHVNELVGSMYGRKLLEDADHHIWIAIDRVGVVCLSADLKKIAKDVSKLEIPKPKGGRYNLTETETGEIICSEGAEITLLNRSRTQADPLSFEGGRSPRISEIQKAGSGQILISTEGNGIWHIDTSKDSKHITQAKLPNLDSHYNQAYIRTFFQDREKNIWLGWFQRGLVFIPAASKQFVFWHILDMDETDKKIIQAISSDSDKHIWYSVRQQGVFEADSTGKVLSSYPELQNITQLLPGPDGQIWFISQSRGLGKINEDKQTVRYLGLFSDLETKAMVWGKNHKLYISTFGKGFAEYDPDSGRYRQFSMDNSTAAEGSLANDWINTIYCDRDGLIWLGHHKGISCYDPEKNVFTNQWANSGLSEQIVLSLIQDKAQNIWAGTYNGLFKVSKENQYPFSYTTNDGLSSNVISGLGADRDGNIWCSTFNGINYLQVAQEKIVTYYTGDGLVDRSYNRSVYYQDKAGKIYFGGKQGITSFYPQQVQLSQYAQPIYITNLYIRNQSIRPGDLSGKQPVYGQSLLSSSDFYFANQDDSFTLELSTMDFNSPENIHYEYRLKGFNKTWNTTLPGVNLITYNNLSPGEHELEIRACKFGAYSASKFVTLHVMPPWYRSTMAYFIYLVLLFGLLALIFNYLQERRLEKLQAYKLQLFTDISHEIRSPLTLVLSPIDKLIRNAGDLQVRETLQSMQRNANRILNLVNQLLDIRKIESGQLQLRFKETNLADFARQCTQPFEQQAKDRNIDFQTRTDVADIPVWIDTASLDKVLHNILSNAFKYTADGGRIELHIRLSSGKQVVRREDNYVQISVSDTGPGIPEQDARHIFRRFYQSNNQISGAQQGSGIGLHLAQVLVEKHGGTITAQNRSDGEQGSIFCIQLPLGTAHLPKAQMEKVALKDNPALTLVPNKDDESDVMENQPATRLKTPQHKTGFKVLVVDDDKDILQFVCQELQGIYKLITAENGSEAFQIALSQEPDLIISDVSMPDMDGFTLVQKIKDNSSTNHIPVILLTAKITQEDRMQGIGLGADAYLTKPFSMDELLVMAENLIKNRMTVKGKYSGAQEQEGKVKTISFKSSDEALMERIVHIVNKYLEDPNLNVQLLADEVGLSRVQLHRKVKALTGISTSEFIRNIRLKQAEKLLLDKQMNISQVAYALGFTNQTHFSTLFKKVYGLSPTEYIARHAQV